MIEISPDFSEAFGRRGYAHLSMNQFRMALDDFDQAASLDREDIWRSLGGVLPIAALGAMKLQSLNSAKSSKEILPSRGHSPQRGGTPRQMFQFDQSLADLNHAVELESADSSTFAERA